MKLGLKLWSNNTDNYLKEAERLYKEGWFDYIELYVVPNTIEMVSKWKSLNTELNIPFTLHAPHFMHGINLAKTEYFKTNIEIFKEVEIFSIELDAQYVVVHSGIEGDINETVRQLNIINMHKILIENKPYIAPLGDQLLCRGATMEEITKVINEVECGFCLDIGHSICTANSLKIEPYEYMIQFNTLNPTCYHLSDNFIDNHIDRHLHLGTGNYDFKKILDIIDLNKNIAIETKKNSKENLDDFIEDVKLLKGIEE